ncbi:tRNA lysidine(34) synthetase TilS [Methylobacterium sp. J-068]|nr:tRNA lysidine(34) synthetase TilS [Methylobacterium sp. J-068]MCJ2033632.1 tRNA lysidine(34) synthetase TilS [Methylobacterium sp. J-068]
MEAALRPHLAGERGRVLLAVSGGPDSTALLAAAAAIGTADTIAVAVATVDHGLRPESAAEARAVADLSARLGLPHRTLAWTGPKPARGLQAAARTARYDLLAAHASRIGARLLLTGHTRDDQAETVLMRLIAGSGPAGLAGMRAERVLPGGLRLARPFLTLPKADLVAYCEARGLGFTRDPSNHDDRFARARLRALMPVLAGEGLSATRLCRLAERCARDTAALEAAAEAAFAGAERPSPEGSIRLNGQTLKALPEAIALRVVGLALERVSPDGAERLERLERLVLDAILPALRAGAPLRRTLRGSLVEVTHAGDVAGDMAGDVALSRAPLRRGRAGRAPETRRD